MTQALTITLRLDRKECIRGESVFFDVTLENSSRTRFDGLPTLDPLQRSIQLAIDGPGGPRTADQLAPIERDGIGTHAPRGKPPTLSLDPGQKLSLQDDLLAWFGELEPGTYQVTARRGLDAVSAPESLKVLRATPLFMSTPRYAAQAPVSPLTGAWVHGLSGPEARPGKGPSGALLFYQQQSSIVPRNSRHGVRAAELKAAPEVHAALVPYGEIARGHVLWLDERGRLFFAHVDLASPGISPEVEVKTPFKGRLLASAMTRADGSLWVPWTDEKGEKVSILDLSPDGDVHDYAVDLGRTKPVGPHVCFWEYARRLQLAWAAQRGREIQYARLPLDDPASGFVTRSAYVSDDPLLWIDAYLDTDAPARAAPYFEEQVPPDKRGSVVAPPGPNLTLWAVAQTAAGLRCTRVDPATGMGKPGATFAVPDLKDLRVLASAVTYRYELALLLADAKDQLFYASTVRGSLQPLAAAAGREVTLEDFPGLVAATSQARDPWVYLRYVQDKKAIDYIRLEPAGDRDPVERQADRGTLRGSVRR